MGFIPTMIHSQRSFLVTSLYFLLNTFPVFSLSQADPPPYAPIANPMPDTLDQQKRDSANLTISRVRVKNAFTVLKAPVAAFRT